MSSCSRTGPERRPRRTRALLAALLTAVLTVQWPGSGAAGAPVGLPIAAILVRGDRTTLVVDLSASTRPGPPSVTVIRDGVPQRADLTPVMGDGLAVALVVDTSVAGAATLPAWQSAGARFILEAPAATRSVVIADSAPATVIAGPQRGPAGTVRALTSVPAGGVRDTAAALTLAVRQFPDAAPGRRVVVLYTTGPDAGGEDGVALAERFRQSGTILVVVGTAGAGPYWAGTAATTGGFFAPAGDPVVVPALDQVSAVLGSRYLVEVPTPPSLPARMSVRVDTADLTLTGDAVVAAPQAPARDGSLARVAVMMWIAVAVLAALLAVTVYVRRRRSRTAPAHQPATDVGEPVVRGRAAVHNGRRGPQ